MNPSFLILPAVSGPANSATYAYNDSANKHIITTINEGQGVYVNTYDSTGRVAKQTHGTGEINFDYTVQYQKTRMTTLIKDGAGNLLNTQTRTVEFDSLGSPSKVTDTFGNVTAYTRDSGNL